MMECSRLISNVVVIPYYLSLRYNAEPKSKPAVFVVIPYYLSLRYNKENFNYL